MTPLHARFSAVLGAALLLVSALPAQVSTASTTVGGSRSYGCQGTWDPATLTGGVLASAAFDFSYDQSTRRLTLVVSNTSAVTSNVPNPLITEIYFNLPDDAIDFVELVDQTGAAGANPSFDLARNDGAGCHGSFDVALLGGSVKGGIANPSADRLPGPPNRAVIGPATFVLELDGPGAGTLTATAIARSFTKDAPAHPAFAAAKFQGGGLGDESGFIGTNNKCLASVYFVGEARIGETVQMCDVTLPGCHDCLYLSLTPGPTVFMGITFPLGVPLLATIDLGTIPVTGKNCLPLAIPDDPGIVGLTVYFAMAAFKPSYPGGYSFSDQVALTILP